LNDFRQPIRHGAQRATIIGRGVVGHPSTWLESLAVALALLLAVVAALVLALPLLRLLGLTLALTLRTVFLT